MNTAKHNVLKQTPSLLSTKEVNFDPRISISCFQQQSAKAIFFYPQSLRNEKCLTKSSCASVSPPKKRTALLLTLTLDKKVRRK